MKKQPNADQCRRRLAASEAKSNALLARIEQFDKASQESALKGTGKPSEVAWMKAEVARLEKSRAAMEGSRTKNKRLLSAAQTYSLDLRPN